MTTNSKPDQSNSPDWEAEARKWGAYAAKLTNELQAMTKARDLCKRQTAEVEALRAGLADEVAGLRSMLGRIRTHGASGLWTGGDCAIGAIAALEGSDAAREFMRKRDRAASDEEER